LRRIISDSWFQVFLLTAAIAAGLMLLPGELSHREPAAPRAHEAARAPAAPEPRAKPLARAPHHAGRKWVVDPDRGPGSDAATVSEAVALAYAGDIVFLRRGLYTDSVVADKALRIVGEGAAGEAVIVGRDSFALAIRGAEVSVEHLTLAAPKGARGPALRVTGGAVKLFDCSVDGSGAQAAVVLEQQGALDSENSSFSSDGTALIISGGARAALTGGFVSAWNAAAVKASGQGSAVKAHGTVFGPGIVGVAADDEAVAELTGCRFKDLKTAALAGPRGTVAVENAAFERVGTACEAAAGGRTACPAVR
jgi:hypothetical protein